MEEIDGHRNIALALGCLCPCLSSHVQVFTALSGSSQNVWIQQLGIPIAKIVADTKTFGLTVEPKLDDDLGRNLKIFCDIDRSGDPETRISGTRIVAYVLEGPVCWCPKSDYQGLSLNLWHYLKP
jgi:hypothetical protein